MSTSKTANVLPVSFKQNSYEQKLKNDILVECATVGFSTYVKYVLGLYLYSDDKKQNIFNNNSDKTKEKPEPNDSGCGYANIKLDL